MQKELIELIKEHCGDSPDAGVEVGVYKGETSAALIHAFPATKLSFVDPWMEWPKGSTYHDAHKRTGKLDQIVWDNVEHEARWKIAHASMGSTQYSEVIKELSDVAAKQFHDETLDFVFIDANHTEESVSADIEAWLPKTKTLLCGHDYGRSYKGVKRAVDRRFGDHVISPGARLWAVDLERWRL
jgi:hypothetical protein